MVDTLDHLPPFPLLVDYRHTWRDVAILTKQDELAIYHLLRLHDRVRRLHLDLPPPILQKVLVLMDGPFPILEHFSFSSTHTSTDGLTFTLPKAFLAPNLLHLTLPGISPPRRLRFLTSITSLVNLTLCNIQTSSYFRPNVLVGRIASSPNLKDLSIEFSVPIPRPRTEKELLGKQGIPTALPSLTNLRFKGVSAYLECLVAQIRAPGLKQLRITLFNQIAFALPHLSHFIDITAGLKLPNATIYFDRGHVSVTMAQRPEWTGRGPLTIRLMCKQLDWQIDCAAQICNALIPVLSRVEKVTVTCYFWKIPIEWQHGVLDDTVWHELLRSFVGVNHFFIHKGLLEELSRALQMDEVGLDPGFLPNLQYIAARRNLFSSFIHTRQAGGLPIEFSRW